MLKNYTTTNKKVMVALSGGVDSSVCLHLLLKEGYDVSAVVLKMSPAHDSTVDAAREVAEKFDIPFYVWDMQESFKKNVVDYFANEYINGKTPNPCIVCNPLVKFKALIDCANEYDCDYIATGHYAKLIQKGENIFLAKSDFEKKDQTYMLYRLKQDVLKRLMLPIGKYEKSKVREIAKDLNLPSANKPDSQDICFIPDNDYASYLTSIGVKSIPGDFIAPEGHVCGKHKGIINYTVGQRKHLGIALGQPVFVKEIDAVNNKIYLAYATDNKYSSAIIDNVSLVCENVCPKNFDAWVKIRSTAKPSKANITVFEDNTAKIEFAEELNAVAKGQSIVIYDEDNTVLGGGFIAKATKSS